MSRPRLRSLSQADRAVWDTYVRQGGLTPARPLPPLAETPAEPTTPPMAKPGPPVANAKPDRSRELAVGDRPDGLDNASWTRLRMGKLAPERVLDLHGRSAQRAFAALHDFLQRAQADRVRCVEIVTGRGSGEHGGIIRREFPFWLNLPALRGLVLGAAYPHAANTGAVRLLIRRQR